MKKWGSIAVVLFILFAIGFFFLRWMARDAPDWPPTRPAISLAPPLPDLEGLTEDNGMTCLEELAWPQDGTPKLGPLIKSWGDVPYGEAQPRFEEVLAKHPKVVRLFEKAANCRHWQAGERRESDSTAVVIQLTMINAYRLERAAVQGKWGQITDLFAQQIRFNRLQAHGGSFAHFYAYLDADQSLFDSLTFILLKTDPPEATLQLLEEILVKQEDDMLVLEGCLKRQREYRRQAIVDMKPPWLPVGGGLKRMDDLWAQQLVDLSLPFGTNGYGDVWIEQSEEPLHLQSLGAPNLVARIYAYETMPRIRRDRELLMLNRLRQQAMLVQISLERHHQKNGVYPGRLEDLVPARLESLPVDPSSPNGEAIRYKKVEDGYSLYALGLDQKDAGGKLSLSRGKADFVFCDPLFLR